jgi:hypothetical protein
MTPTAVLLATLAMLLGTSTAALAQSDSLAAGDFRPTTEVPWNPPRALSSMRPWEMVLRAPGRIATLPLSALGMLTRNTMLELEEHSLVPKTLHVLAKPVMYGIYVMPANLGDRTGLGGQVSYVPDYANKLVSVGISGSTGHYSRFEAGIGPRIGRFDYVQEWRPHDRLFGIGMDTSEDDETSYSNSTRLYQLSSRVGFDRPVRGQPPRLMLFGSAATREMTLGAPQGEPDEDTEFDPASTPIGDALDREWKGQIWSAAFQADFRRGAPHWSRGWRALVGYDRYDPRHQAPMASGGPGPIPQQFATFNRYIVDLQGGVSFHRDPRTIRLLVRAVDTEIDDRPERQLIPVSDLPGLGGREGLAGFESGRFHDLDALLTRASYIFPLAQHYELDLHVEAGGVYRDLQNDARLRDLKTSYGVSFRPRTHMAVVGVVGVDWSREGARIHYSLGGVE